MPFMKKEELLAEAERLGIDISNLKYQDQVAAVAQAQHKENEQKELPQQAKQTQSKVKDSDEKQLNNDKRQRDLEWGRKTLNEIKDTNIIIAPAIRPEMANVLFKYDEELGDEVEVQELSFDLDSLGPINGDVNRDGTYKVVKKNNGKKVVAQSTVPKENAGISYKPNGDWFPVITDPTTGAKGYQYKRYVKPLLEKSGYFQDYADYFDNKKHPNNVFYICGHCCVSKSVVDWIFNDINRKERERRER